MNDDYAKFTAPRHDEEIHQGESPPVTFGIDPQDGLPVQVTQENLDKPPVLSEETLVCMADKRSFVIRNSDGSIWVEFEPSEVQRLQNGEYGVTPAQVMAKDPAVDMSVLQDHGRCRNGDRGARVVLVEPIRPACEHYIRALTDTSVDRGARFLSRACGAQRSETGEYVSVGDALIAACSLRRPRHIESEDLMDAFDANKIRQGKEREAPGFDVDAELAAEAGKLGVLG